jgi:hypothetical protein
LSVHLLAVALGCAWLVSCHKPEVPVMRTYAGHGFTMILSDAVRANVDGPAPDMMLYDLHVGSRQLLSAYAGVQPNFPHFEFSPDSQGSTALKSGLQGTCRAKTTNHHTSRECLFVLDTKTATKLHVWYERLDDKLQQQADVVIATIAPTAL